MLVSILNKCVGCGACAVINSEIFEIYNKSATVNSDKIEGQELSCIDAAINCPINAINISI